jgi:hypothetical protein
MKQLICIISYLVINLQAFGQNVPQDYWILACDENYEKCGYLNSTGDTVIEFGKYSMYYTDTFRIFAVVLKSGHGFVGIDRNEKILFKVFPYDNGPDSSKEGKFRIITPQFECAFPFENGKAKVALVCRKSKEMEGEYTTWLSNQWYYIDASGRRQ